MVNKEEAIDKPRFLVVAVNLLWASLVLGLIATFLDWQYLINAASLSIILTGIIISLVVSIWLILKIASGHNWARHVYLILFLIGLVPSIFVLTDVFLRSPGLAIVRVLQIILQLIALALLFLSPARRWFEKNPLTRRSRIGLGILYLVIITFASIIYYQSFLAGVKKDVWLKNFEVAFNARGCEVFLKNNPINMKQPINLAQCQALVKTSMQKCRQQFYLLLPEKLNVKTGRYWGQRIGRCVGEDFYAQLRHTRL